MDKENKIGNFQLTILSFFLTISMTVGVCTRVIIERGKSFSWIGSIVSVIIGLLVFLLFNYIHNKKDNLTLSELNEKIFGKILGNIINLISIIFSVMFFIFVLWSISSFFISQFAVETPTIALNLLFIIPVILANIFGIESIARTFQLFFFISIILIFSIYFGIIPLVHVNNLFPIFNANTKDIMSGILIETSYTVLPLFLLFSIPTTQVNKSIKFNKSIFTGYLLGGINNILVFLYPLLIFGYDLAVLAKCPAYAVLKKIKFFGFLDRLENIFSMLKLLPVVALLIMLMYYIITSSKRIVKVKNKKIVNIFTILFSIALAFLSISPFKSQVNGDNWFQNTGPFYIGIAFLLMPIITFIRLLFYKKIKSLHKIETDL